MDLRLHTVPAADIPADGRVRGDRRLLAAASQGLSWLAERVVLFRLGDLVFVNFGLFAALGALVGLSSMGVILMGQGLTAPMFAGLALVGCTGIVVGSWLAAQLLDYRLVLRSPGRALRRPVFVSWGGILLLPFMLLLFSSLAGVDALLLMDGAARTVLLGHAIGRLGCLTYGCCFGRPTRHGLAITYRNPLSKAVRVARLHGVRLHPAPLYEAGMDLGIILLINLAVAAGVPLGVPTALAFLLYGLGRFGLEFVKDNEGRFVAGRWAVNHIVCLGLVVLGLSILYGVLQTPEAAPAVQYGAGLDAILGLMPAIVPCALLTFVGFSLHRHDVGRW